MADTPQTPAQPETEPVSLGTVKKLRRDVADLQGERCPYMRECWQHDEFQGQVDLNADVGATAEVGATADVDVQVQAQPQVQARPRPHFRPRPRRAPVAAAPVMQAEAEFEEVAVAPQARPQAEMSGKQMAAASLKAGFDYQMSQKAPWYKLAFFGTTTGFVILCVLYFVVMPLMQGQAVMGVGGGSNLEAVEGSQRILINDKTGGFRILLTEDEVNRLLYLLNRTQADIDALESRDGDAQYLLRPEHMQRLTDAKAAVIRARELLGISVTELEAVMDSTQRRY